jgi:predicted SAM-dependent methyltransferase
MSTLLCPGTMLKNSNISVDYVGSTNVATTSHLIFMTQGTLTIGHPSYTFKVNHYMNTFREGADKPQKVQHVTNTATQH